MERLIMKKCTILSYLLTLALTAGLNAATPPQRSSSDDWCRDENWGRDRETACEVREYTVPASGATLSVNAEPNGGISVAGTQRMDVLVRAKVSATADTLESARALLARIVVTATADHVSADGPGRTGDRESWSVSYRLSVPVRTPLSLRSTNGGVTIDNVVSQVDVRTVNGGVSLSRMGGDVKGRTTNGGVNVVLDGSTWDGAGLDVETSNGGVTLAIPRSYSAHLETGTTNGGLRLDFPVTVTGEIGRSFSTDLGGGGPTLKVRTSNGGVTIRQR
jgi:hypothetical protein